MKTNQPTSNPTSTNQPKETTMSTKTQPQSNLQPKKEDVMSNLETLELGVISCVSNHDIQEDAMSTPTLPFSWEAIFEGEFDHITLEYNPETDKFLKKKVRVNGLPGVATMFESPKGKYVLWDMVGFTLMVNGLAHGESKTALEIDAKRAKRLLANKPFAFISKVHLAKKAKDHTYDVKYREFKTADEAAKAVAFMRPNTNQPEELKDVLRLAKRANRATSEFEYVAAEQKSTGMLWMADGSSIHCINRLPRIKVVTPSPRDGEIQARPEFMKLWSNEFKIGSRWNSGSIYGPGGKIQIDQGITRNLGHGQKKGMITVVSKMDPEWDIICYDGPKAEHSLSGVFCMGVGGEAHTGHRSHTDLMLVSKSYKFSNYCGDFDDKVLIDDLIGLMHHLQTARLDDVVVDQKDLKDSDPKKTLLRLQKFMAKKHGLKHKKMRPTNSIVITAAEEDLDVSLIPLLVDRYGYFHVGDEGSRATRYRRSIPNAVDIEMFLYDPEAFPESPLYPAATGREVVFTISEDGVPMAYCAEEVWPEISEYTGGSDFDDRWQAWAFKNISKATKDKLGLNTAHAYSAWLFRQPDGPGDGAAVDLVFGIGYLTVDKDTIWGPVDFFDKIPTGKQANEMFSDILERIEKVRNLVLEKKELEKQVKAIMAKTSRPRGQYRQPDPGKKFNGFPSAIKLKKTNFKNLNQLAKNEAETSRVSTNWWDYNSISAPGIGPVTNVNSSQLEAFLAGKASVFTKYYLACMLSEGLLEIAIDWDNMGKGSPEDLARLSEIYYMMTNHIQNVEKSHIVGKSKGFKVRVSSKNGVYIPSLWKFHSPDFKWPKRRDYGNEVDLTEDFKAKITEICQKHVVKHHEHKYLSEEGKVAVAEACGLKVYEGELTPFYQQIHQSYSDAHIMVKTLALEFQLRWYDEFLSGQTDPMQVNLMMAKMVGKEFASTINTIYKQNGRTDLDYDTKAETIVNLIRTEVPKNKMDEFFTSLMWADIFQMRVSKDNHYYSSLVSSGKFEGWITRAQRGLQTCAILQKVAQTGKHPEEFEGCTPEAIDLHENGFIREKRGSDVVELAFSDAWKLRTLAHIPKGKVIEYTSKGDPIRDNSWMLKGKTFQGWYISAYKHVAEVLNK